MLPEPLAAAGREAVPRGARACLCILFAAASLALASCQDESVFGLPAGRFAEILAGEDPAPFLAIPDREFESAGKLDAEVYYYLGRWIEDRARPASALKNGAERSLEAPRAEGAEKAESDGITADPAARAILLYRLAHERATGPLRRETARVLAAALAKAGANATLAAFAREHRAEEGPDWAVDRPALDAMYELELDGESLDALAALRASFPDEAAGDEDALLFFEGAAARRLGKAGWSVPLKALLFERPGTNWTAKALELLEGAASPDAAFSTAEYRVARMRAAIVERDYGLAYREMAPVMDFALSPRSSPATVADAGKAFLYSNMAKQGMEPFASLESRAAEAAARGDLKPALAEAARQVAWNALFYRGRFALSLELWPEAVQLFRRAAASSTRPADLDAALWYGVDAASRRASAEAAEAAVVRYRGAKTKAAKAAAEKAAEARGIAAKIKAKRDVLAALAEAAPAWNESERFADLVDGLFREAIQARDWELVVAIDERLAGRTPPSLNARIAYTAARATELGLFVPSGGPERKARERDGLERFAAIAADSAAPLHYRALAAWRSGAALDLLPPELPQPEAPERRPEAESFILGFIPYGLADLAVEESRRGIDELAPDSLRRIAQALMAAGRADCAIRLASTFVARPGWEARRSDYELLYPRPFLSDYRAIRPAPSCPEQLFYGLVRSESLFREDIASWAGAVGLSQLMPSTASEVAASLGLSSYDLRSARDNLRIGAALFAELLGETGRPLRAMMAYNAGRGRLRRWTTESGELPDDLMLEAIGISETRQYGRNILQASVMYGELYYGVSAAKTAALAVEGGEF